MSDVPKHPLERLKEQAEEAKKRREKEIVSCPECGTEILKDDMQEAIETAESHDEQRHDGERTTLVNGILPPEFTEEEKQMIQNAVSRIQQATENDASRREL
jgi:hypothetical protein